MKIISTIFVSVLLGAQVSFAALSREDFYGSYTNVQSRPFAEGACQIARIKIDRGMEVSTSGLFSNELVKGTPAPLKTNYWLGDNTKFTVEDSENGVIELETVVRYGEERLWSLKDEFRLSKDGQTLSQVRKFWGKTPEGRVYVEPLIETCVYKRD